MSFPNKEKREACWNSRDIYWKCIDEKNSVQLHLCEEFRKQYEKFCSVQWVFAISLGDMEPVHLPLKVKVTSNCKIEKDIIKSNQINLESLKSIIAISVKNCDWSESDTITWKPVLNELLHSLCTNEEIGNEIILLASHAYLSLRKALYKECDFESTILSYFNLQTNLVIDFNRVYNVYDIELFKLIISNGFLQLGNNVKCTYEIYKIIFKNIYLHCMRYTRYTYFAFKVLNKWMLRTSKRNFWSENTILLEEKLEAVIFSNWDNSLCKANIVSLFTVYLDVMKKKYENFLSYLFYSCTERISWCHVNKYIILAEICSALDNIELLTDSKFISNLFNSLTINHLCKASTKVYTNICYKFSKDLWKKTFGEPLKNYIITWESEKRYDTLQVLCKCWIEFTVKHHRDILPFLWACSDEESILYRSHLLRIAKKYDLTLSLNYCENPIFLDHEEEIIRLNIFAAHCYEVGNLRNNQYLNSVMSIKHFLFFNATADVAYLREGIFNYFKIFLSNMLKRSFIEKNSKELIHFLDWLNEFQKDAFEIGSCYQRKVFGLHLYNIILQFFFSNCCSNTILSKDPKFKQGLKYAPLLRSEMEKCGKWKFMDKHNIVLLFKLILDPAIDIKQHSTSIILEFFSPDIISDTEKFSLFITAFHKCNSFKFFEIEAGAFLFKILSKWFPLNDTNKANIKLDINFELLSVIEKHQSYVKFLYEAAMQQLFLMKEDIFKAATQKTPFYGFATALLITGFNNQPERYFITKEFLEQIMNMVQDAVNFFLNAFSLKVSSSENSSFEEISLAVHEAIKNSELNYEFDELVLSPAQQVIITCIWRSLKVLCELAVEVIKSECATNSLISRAGETIVSVLLKCRFKGVIESAGVAIANLSRYLTGNNSNVELLEQYLKKLLTNDFSTNINLTRRGAGLTIMLHKIVANDVRFGRPLLHFAINSLIQLLRKKSTTKDQPAEISNYDNPCAMYLHFLKTLVADKQLQPQLTPYLECISLICFEFMSSSIFVICNASLLLFGALVSRLVGQNTGAKTVDFGYGYSINYFATHYPQLAAYVLLSLQDSCQILDRNNSNWQNSTNIIHFLSLLSKMFFSGCEIIDGTSITYVKQIRNCLNLFLSSPMAAIRNVAAKSMTAIVGLSSIEREMSQLKARLVSITNFNHLNGYLYTLEYLYEKREDEIRSTTVKHSKIRLLSEVRKNLMIRMEIQELWNFWIRRSTLIKKRKLCYVVEAQLVRLSHKFKLEIKENYTVESKNKHNFDTLFEKTKPGFFEFINEVMNLFVNYISYNEDKLMVKTILGARCTEFGVCFLKHAPRQNRNLLISVIDYAISNFDKMPRILLEEVNIYSNESVRNIFHGRLIELQNVDISKLNIFASQMQNSFPRTINTSELLTFTHVLSLRGSSTCNLFEDLIYCISKEKITLANYFTCSEIIRQLIAKGLEVLLHNFNNFNSKNRIIPLLVSLVLMKDEVNFIRDLICNSVLDNIIMGCKLSTGRIMDQVFYVILMLNLISEKPVFGELNNKDVIQFFEKYLSVTEQHSTKFDIENPFHDNNISPYKEESKIINFIVFCIEQKLSKGPFTFSKGTYKNISCNIFNTKHDLLKKMNIDYSNLQDILDIRCDEYVAHKLKVVSEAYFEKK